MSNLAGYVSVHRAPACLRTGDLYTKACSSNGIADQSICDQAPLCASVTHQQLLML